MLIHCLQVHYHLIISALKLFPLPRLQKKMALCQAGRSLVEYPVSQTSLSKSQFDEQSDCVVQLVDQRQIKVQAIDKQIREAFPLPDLLNVKNTLRRGLADERNNHYFYCNEFDRSRHPVHPSDFKRVIQAIDNMAPETKPISAPVKAAFLVGESCLLAASPAIAKQ